MDKVNLNELQVLQQNIIFFVDGIIIERWESQ